MQALVLVGGEGTRLRPLTLTQPKPAVPLVDRPFIGYMVDWLASHGVDDVVMACGFRAEDLRSALGDGEEGGPRIRYVQESEPLGTAGPIRLAADQGLLGERFCVLNGDLLTDIDLSRTIAAHEGSGRVATISLYPVDDPSAFGLVRRDGVEVSEFLEKPDPESDEIDTDEVNAGAYVLERGICELIPAGRKVSIERDVFPRLTDGRLGGVRLEGYWKDIGTPERYLEASWDILEGTVATEVGRRAGDDGVLIEAEASVADGAEITGPAWVGPGAVVGPGARLDRAVVAAGVEIGPGARIEDSVALAGTRLGENARVERSILAPDVEVEAGAHVPAGAVVGAGARIGAGAALGSDARVAPGEVSE
ncbi:NDP-sugar synthase [Thermoleophilia bacterium SCSIO 60948]|nr:NDP-sugar synthase [Thermoleophilia bacterium SCSIO 60948]